MHRTASFTAEQHSLAHELYRCLDIEFNIKICICAVQDLINQHVASSYVCCMHKPDYIQCWCIQYTCHLYIIEHEELFSVTEDTEVRMMDQQN